MSLVRNAWLGWTQYIDDGKYAVLLLGALLYLGSRCLTKGNGKRTEEVNTRLVVYASLVTVCVICPLSAAVLMLYQTKFYDYIWLWTLVPVTLIIAYGGTYFYQSCYNRYWRGKILKPAACVLSGLALLLLCGNLGDSQNALTGSTGFSGGPLNSAEERTKRIMDELTENGNNTDICLWAPKELLQNVRAVNGSVKLLYGRDMWEKSLGGYSYDVYDEETIMLYEYMESLCGEQDVEQADDRQSEGGACQDGQAYVCVAEALARGVNTIILPDSSPADVISAVEDRYGRQDWAAVNNQDTAGLLLFAR